MATDIQASIIHDNADAFRKVWRGFGSTVALIATEHDGERYAMLATAVTSVSMDPPSLLVCINRSASAYAAFVARKHFSLGLLPANAHEIGQHLARASGSDRFARGNWQHIDDGDLAATRLPYLSDADATLFCQIDKAIDYGTHTIFISLVRAVKHSLEEGVAPHTLHYCEGQFGAFARTA